MSCMTATSCCLGLTFDLAIKQIKIRLPTDFYIFGGERNLSIKEEVLRTLSENKGCYISGSNMAQELGVTRGGIWKAVKSLTKDGYQIEAVTNRGYKLIPGAGKLNKYHILRMLKTEFFGKPLHVLESVDSTNNYAKALAANGAAHGTAVLAQMQTGGRGRIGRSFLSLPGAGMYLSVILRPNTTAENALLLTSAAAVAVCRAVERFIDKPAHIKWVNDVYVDGKKLCGILTEAASDLESGNVEYAVVGIGINLTCEAFPPELKDIATAVSEHGGADTDCAELTAAVLYELERVCSELESAEFMEEYKSRSCVIGKRVKAIRAGVSREVFIKNIDDTGALIAENEKGEEERINSGEISIKFL